MRARPAHRDLLSSRRFAAVFGSSGLREQPKPLGDETRLFGALRLERGLDRHDLGRPLGRAFRSTIQPDARVHQNRTRSARDRSRRSARRRCRPPGGDLVDEADDGREHERALGDDFLRTGSPCGTFPGRCGASPPIARIVRVRVDPRLSIVTVADTRLSPVRFRASAIMFRIASISPPVVVDGIP